MPSDCQCSSSSVEVRVIDNKEATKRLKKLEEENKQLRSDNSYLKTSLKKASKSKGLIIEELKQVLGKA